MQKLTVQSIAAGAVMRIEICLPRVFPWKLRGGDRPGHGGYHKVHHTDWRRTNETFLDTSHRNF